MTFKIHKKLCDKLGSDLSKDKKPVYAIPIKSQPFAVAVANFFRNYYAMSADDWGRKLIKIILKNVKKI